MWKGVRTHYLLEDIGVAGYGDLSSTSNVVGGNGTIRFGGHEVKGHNRHRYQCSNSDFLFQKWSFPFQKMYNSVST